MSNPKSRYRSVTRRRFIQTSALGGLAALIPGLACGTDAATSQPALEDSPGDPPSSSSSVSSGAGQSLATGEMVVSFSYVASSSGRVHSPYIAVWVEDAGGNLVRTISLWFKSDERKYLKDLGRWSDADGQGDQAVLSGATRLPGEYSVVWDGTTAEGLPVVPGEYHLCIEAAREDGPYELIRQAITLDGSAFTLALPDDGELTAASVEYVA